MTENPTQTPRPAGRRRALAWGVLTVLALALVILGVSALSSPKDTGPPADSSKVSTNPNDSAAAESRLLLQRARDALASGDTTKAVDLARQAVDADPDNDEAQDLLDSLTDDAASQDDSSTPAALHVSDPVKLLPTKIAGYSIDTAMSDGTDAVMTADPASGSQDFKSINHVLLGAHDRGSEAKARSFVDDVHKRVYGTGRTEVPVAGGSGYFGTDGGRLACIAFYRGQYAFEIVITAQDAAPAALKDAAIRLANTFRMAQ